MYSAVGVVQVTRLHSVNSGYKGGQRSVTQITIVSQHVITNHSLRSFLCGARGDTFTEGSQELSRSLPDLQTRGIPPIPATAPTAPSPPDTRRITGLPSGEPKKPYFLATSFKPCTTWPLSEHVFQHLASMTPHC